MIIDAHAHMFTEGMFAGMKMPRGFRAPQRMIEAAKHSVEDNTAAWISAMDKLGIEKTVFMSTAQLNADFIRFINSSERLIGFAKTNPTLPDAVEILKKELAAGMTGIKLYATSGEFNVGAKEAWSLYEYCEKNHVPITIHFGVTIGGTADLYTGNPIHISRVLSDFPDLKIAIAHFGAGYFREALMLKYKRENLFIETSGTNNWLPHQDNFLTLKDVFKKSIEVFGAQHVMFGTDTSIFPDGYREHILRQQQEILDELKIPESDREDIMYNNAKRFLNL